MKQVLIICICMTMSLFGCTLDETCKGEHCKPDPVLDAGTLDGNSENECELPNLEELCGNVSVDVTCDCDPAQICDNANLDVGGDCCTCDQMPECPDCLCNKCPTCEFSCPDCNCGSCPPVPACPACNCEPACCPECPEYPECSNSCIEDCYEAFKACRSSCEEMLCFVNCEAQFDHCWRCECENECEEPCGCEGKVSTLVLKYYGEDAHIRVEQKKDGQNIFEDNISRGDVIQLAGASTHGDLTTEITIYMSFITRCHKEVTIHTSCSEPIGPGARYGDFEVLSGTSSQGSLELCTIVD